MLNWACTKLDVGLINDYTLSMGPINKSYLFQLWAVNNQQSCAKLNLLCSLSWRETKLTKTVVTKTSLSLSWHKGQTVCNLKCLSDFGLFKRLDITRISVFVYRCPKLFSFMLYFAHHWIILPSTWNQTENKIINIYEVWRRGALADPLYRLPIERTVVNKNQSMNICCLGLHLQLHFLVYLE